MITVNLDDNEEGNSGIDTYSAIFVPTATADRVCVKRLCISNVRFSSQLA